MATSMSRRGPRHRRGENVSPCFKGPAAFAAEAMCGLAGLLVVMLIVCHTSGCQEQSEPSEICEGFTIDDENALRASIEMARDEGRTLEETLDQLLTFCVEGPSPCEECVTDLAEDVFGESAGSNSTTNGPRARDRTGR